MKNDIEKQILEMINEYTPKKPKNSFCCLAKELDTLTREYYFEFIAWKDINVVKTKTSSYWVGTKRFETLPELYQYWCELKKKGE